MPAGSQRRAAGASSLAQKPGFVGAAARFWQRSYAGDYVGLIGLAAGWLSIVIFVEPFHRMFSLDNLAIQYPHAEVERVSVIWLFIYAVFVPLITLSLWTIVFLRHPHTTHVTLLGLATALFTTMLLTDILKNAIGRPRPDLLARCKPRPGTPSPSLVTYAVCSETDHHVLHDGWRSFPSGHSSFSFAGLGYTGIWMCGRWGVLRARRTVLAKWVACFVPFVGATMIATSRLADYRHDVYDVTVGSIIGITLAYLSYRRYFPRLRSRRCGEPYANPAEAVDAGFRKVRGGDEESGIRGAEEFELESLGSEDEDEDEDGVSGAEAGGDGKGRKSRNGSSSRGRP